MATVTVSRIEDQLIAIKWVAAENASELEREAEILQLLNHPGVVGFIDLVTTSDGGRALHTLFVSSDTWATRPLLDSTERAAGVAALAAVIADLHELGMTHRYITAAHILHGENDRPVLCSLTRAGDASPENRQIDLAALAELIHDENMKRSSLKNELAHLADEMRGGQLDARDLANKLDRLLKQRTPGAKPNLPSGWLKALPNGRLRALSLNRFGTLPEKMANLKPVKTAIIVGLGLGVTGLVMIIAASNNEQAQSPEQATASDLAEPPTVSAQPPVVETSARTSTTTTTPANGTIIEHRGRRYIVGIADDIVLTGDWDCNGEVTPSIVRPSIGAVSLFNSWPKPGETISRPISWRVDAVTDVQVENHGTCDVLRVHTTTGSYLLDPKGMP